MDDGPQGEGTEDSEPPEQGPRVEPAPLDASTADLVPPAGAGEEPAAVEDPPTIQMESLGPGGCFGMVLAFGGFIAWVASGATVFVYFLLVVLAMAFVVWLLFVVGGLLAVRDLALSAQAEPITPRGQPLLPGFDAPGPVAALLDEAALVPASAWARAHRSLARSARRDHLRVVLLPLAILVVLFGDWKGFAVEIPGPAALLLGAADLAFFSNTVVWGVAYRLQGPRLFIGKVVDRHEGGPKGDDYMTGGAMSDTVDLLTGKWAPSLVMQLSVVLGIDRTGTLYRHDPPAGNRIIYCQRKLWEQVKDDDVVAVLAASSGRVHLRISDLTGGEEPSHASEPGPDSSAGEDLLGVRIGAALIDLALLQVLFVVLAVVVGVSSVDGVAFSFSLDWAGFALYSALALLYYLVLEAAIGQTVGKLLVGLRVVRAVGGRPSVWAVATRTVLRVVDWLPLLYLVGFIAMLATGARRERLGDLAAGTRIARAVPMRHRGLAAAGLASSLLLVLAGSVIYVAASDQDEGAQTYRGNGVSFDYPAGWEEGSVQGSGTNELWKTGFSAVAAGELNLVLVEAYRLTPPVTADAAKAEFDKQVRQAVEQNGQTVQAGPEDITVAGKPGLRFRTTGTVDGTPTENTLVLIFDGATMYNINCQHTAEGAEEIERGCQQIVRTFKVDRRRWPRLPRPTR